MRAIEADGVACALNRSNVQPFLLNIRPLLLNVLLVFSSLYLVGGDLSAQKPFFVDECNCYFG